MTLPAQERNDPPAIVVAVRERRAELLQAMNDVEAAIAAPGRGREEPWRTLVVDRVRALRVTLDEHVSVTEDAGGLFEQILAESPRLSHRVETLRAEHRAIGARLDAIAEYLAHPVDSEARLDDLRRDLVALLGDLAHHRQLGADLLWEAYWVDIGGPSI